MTYDEIVTHVIQARFKEGQREKVQRWVQRRYSLVWVMADWPWRRVGPTAVAVTASDSTPPMPSDIHRPMAVYNERGELLVAMTAEAFDARYLTQIVEGTLGTPEAWKWEDGVLTLAPTPQASGTFQLTYERRIAHRSSTDVLTDGVMDADTDLPVWSNRSFDYLLVPGAIATGLKEENDPTWRDLEEESRGIIDEMREFYLPSLSPFGNVSYGGFDSY